MKIKLAGVLSLYLAAGTLHAQSDKSLSLQESIQIALESNTSIQRSKYDTEIFEEQVKEVRRNALPQIAFNASQNYYFELPSQVADGNLLGGGDSGSDYVPLQFGVPHQTSLNLQLSQVLFNPELSVGIEAAKKGRQYSEVALAKTKEEVVFNVSLVYFNAQAIHTQIELLQENLKSMNELLRVTQLLEESGLAKATEVGRLKLNKLNLETNIINQQQAYKTQINNLKLILNKPLENELTIETAIDQTEVEVVGDGGSKLRSDLQLLRYRGELKALEKKQINARYLPSLNAIGAYNQSGFGDLSKDYYEFFPSSYVGVQLSVPVFDGFIKRSQKRQKDIEFKQIQLDEQYLKRSIQNEETDALAKLSIQKEAVKVQKSALSLAQEVYENVNLQYKEGTVGITELLESDNELRRTQNDYLNAWIRLKQAQLDLSKARGALLN